MKGSTKNPVEWNEVDRSTYRKNFWRIIPFIFICYCFAYIDRINLLAITHKYAGFVNL